MNVDYPIKETEKHLYTVEFKKPTNAFISLIVPVILLVKGVMGFERGPIWHLIMIVMAILLIILILYRCISPAKPTKAFVTSERLYIQKPNKPYMEFDKQNVISMNSTSRKNVHTLTLTLINGKTEILTGITNITLFDQHLKTIFN